MSFSDFARIICLLITLQLSILPFLIYTAAIVVKNYRQKHVFLVAVKQYSHTFIFFSALYLILFSFYQRLPVMAAIDYLAQPFALQHIKFGVLTCFLSLCVLLVYLKLQYGKEPVEIHVNKIPVYIYISLWIFLFFLNAALEFTATYGIIPVEQFIFHLSLPRTGANFSMVTQFIISPFVDSVVCFIFAIYIVSVEVNIFGNSIRIPFDRFKKISILVAVLLPIGGVLYALFAVKLPHYLLTGNEKPSLFYEENYIFSQKVEITFPEKKRNLIVIIVESLETGFLTRENGGAFTEDLIPEITALAKNNINFSPNEGIGGAVQLYGTEWTAASITAYYSGLPLAVRFVNETDGNNYAILGEEFMPRAYGVGDILNNAGYRNYFILGSDIGFGARDKFFETHKDTVIFDYNYFRNNDYFPDGYSVWWGIEDRKLYRFAKTKISEIAKEDTPFFITLLTADTHPVGGYLDEQAEIIFDSQYKNVLRDMSKQLSDFLEWLGSQPFYENSTVVVLGDHLYMDSTIFPEEFAGAYQRSPLNIFINSLLPHGETKNRIFSHFDMLPLLIESIGGLYDARGLALGRSLRGSNEPDSTVTLVEQYGISHINSELARKSELYNSLWRQ